MVCKYVIHSHQKHVKNTVASVINDVTSNSVVVHELVLYFRILSLAVLVFGFEYPEYTVGEEEGSVEVCVRIRAPNDTSVPGVALLSTVKGTALGT